MSNDYIVNKYKDISTSADKWKYQYTTWNTKIFVHNGLPSYTIITQHIIVLVAVCIIIQTQLSIMHSNTGKSAILMQSPILIIINLNYYCLNYRTNTKARMPLFKVQSQLLISILKLYIIPVILTLWTYIFVIHLAFYAG